MQRQQLISALGLVLALIACVTSGVTWSQLHNDRGNSSSTTPPDHYTPPPSFEIEVGTFMATLSRRTATLWFAAKAGNAGAAEYELTEMGEVIDDIVAASPVENGVDIGSVLDAVRNTHFDRIRAVLATNNQTAFEAEYKALLDSCNSCHVNVGLPFIRLTIPESSPVSNRDWSAGMK